MESLGARDIDGKTERSNGREAMSQCGQRASFNYEVEIPSRRERPSQFANFFDLKLREAVSHGLPSFDCYNLGSVARHLGVYRMAEFASQQIHLSILGFDSGRLPASDTHSRTFGMIRTAQVVSDVAGHIEHFAGHDNFLRARGRTMAALRPLHHQQGYTCRDEDGRSKL